jgi:aquaporin Z
MNLLAVLVEFLGTFLFMSVIVATGNPLAIGATLAILILLGGAVSGGHFNPATTTMMLYNRGIAADNAIAYILVQVAAALLAVSVYNRLKKRFL